jgi:hypothetical protein
MNTIGAVYTVEHIRNGEVLSVETCSNIVPTEGLNHILNTVFAAGTQVTTWYVGVFEGNYTPVASDTAATFPGSAFECTAYSESVRQTYVEAPASGGVITNVANKAVFTFNATKTIYGGFLSSDSVKSAITGTLVSAARFSTAKVVDNGDILRIAAEITMTST